MLSEQRMGALNVRTREIEERLRGKESELAQAKQQFQQLTTDFRYNLKLLEAGPWHYLFVTARLQLNFSSTSAQPQLNFSSTAAYLQHLQVMWWDTCSGFWDNRRRTATIVKLS